jgi:hypothetical protein
MNELHAKPVVEGKFWIVEEGKEKIGVLKVTEQKKYVFSSKDVITTFDNKKTLFEKFGKDFFIKGQEKSENIGKKEIYGFPTSSLPHNSMFNVKRKLPLFTKSSKSKSVYCAGYYIIKFNKGWVKSFCPKLITIDRYPYQGPFTNELEMKERLNRAQ